MTPLFNMFLAILIATCVVPRSGAQAWEPTTQPGDLSTDAEINAAISAMNDPLAHVAEYGRLLRFSESYAVNMGSGINGSLYSWLEDHPELKARVARVNTALEKVRIDLPLVKAGFADPTMVKWAVGAVERLRSRDEPDADVHNPELLALLPTVRKYAVDGDEQTRAAAQQTLQYFPTEQAFAASLADTETSPENVMRLVDRFPAEVYFRNMNSQLVRLLQDERAAVRARALEFISLNSNMASMWQCKFDADVVSRVENLCGAGTDRVTAARALGEIHALDPANAIPLLAKLATDNDSAVRVQVAMGILNDQANPRIQAIMETLRRDSDDAAKYFAISGLGLADHMAELRALTHSKNTEIAEIAAGALERVEQDRRRVPATTSYQ